MRPSFRGSPDGRPCSHRSRPGEAAIFAGAIDAGLAQLRGAVASARTAEGEETLTRALIGLGSALVHAARGTDEEGAAALHEGSALAERAGKHQLAATGWRGSAGSSSSVPAATARKHL